MTTEPDSYPPPPLAPFVNGHRDAAGRFKRGNPGGPGNPGARRSAKLKMALLNAVKPSDMRAVTRRLVEMATAGDLQAVALLFDRVLGKVVPAEATDDSAAIHGPHEAIPPPETNQELLVERTRMEVLEVLEVELARLQAEAAAGDPES